MHSKFTLDIEKYYLNLENERNAQLRAMAYIQYPLYCLHCKIKVENKDSINQLDKHILDLIEDLRLDEMAISNVLGVSKALVKQRVNILIGEGLLLREDQLNITQLGQNRFLENAWIRYETKNHDFYLDGSELTLIDENFLKHNRRFIIGEGDVESYERDGEIKYHSHFAPDLTHTPFHADLSDTILEHCQTLKGFNGLVDIQILSFTKMAFPVLIGLSLGDQIHKELVNGFNHRGQIDSLSMTPMLESMAKGVMIQTYSRSLSSVKTGAKLLTFFSTNWQDVNKDTDTIDRIFRIPKEDLSKLIKRKYALGKEPVIHSNRTEILVEINKETLLSAEIFKRPNLIMSIIRQRDYFLNSRPSKNGVWLVYFSLNDAEDQYVKEVCLVYESCKMHRDFEDLIEPLKLLKSKLQNPIRELLVSCGFFDVLEEWDVREYMISATE